MAARSDQALRRVAAALLAQFEATMPAADGSENDVRLRTGVVMVLVTDALQTLGMPTATRPDSASDHLRHRQLARPALARVGRSAIGTDATADLLRQAQTLLADLTALLGSGQLPACVDTLFGVARTSDYLRGVLVDLLCLALHRGYSLAPNALVEGTRTLTAVLADRFPGAVIEVRVPPAAAVQVGALGQGPIHTRGTPPNVIETDVETFVKLATGHLAWREAKSSGAVQASGAQIDAIARMLPVVDGHFDLS